MPLIDLFRNETLYGRVLDKYRLDSGNLGVILEDYQGQRYSVEFKTDDTGPCYDNLYGFLNEPFKGKGDYLEKLIDRGNYVEMTVSYSKSPIRNAYRLHTVSNRPFSNGYQHQPRYLPQ